MSNFIADFDYNLSINEGTIIPLNVKAELMPHLPVVNDIIDENSDKIVSLKAFFRGIDITAILSADEIEELEDGAYEERDEKLNKS